MTRTVYAMQGEEDEEDMQVLKLEPHEAKLQDHNFSPQVHSKPCWCYCLAQHELFGRTGLSASQT